MLARILALIVVAAPIPAPLSAQASPPATDSGIVRDTFTIASKALGEPRLVNVHVPAGYTSSSAAFPVLYMPDGAIDEDFPHVVRTVDSLVALGKIRPVIVVGVPNTQRRRDLTGPTRVAKDSAIAPRVGGSAAFRRFFRDELFPVVRARYRTTAERSIIGESLAGLFIVETFLLEPGMFDHYVAFDPSLWWNAGALTDAAAAHLAALGTTRRSLYLSSSKDDIETAKLAALLRTSAPSSLTWQFVPRPDLAHSTIFNGMGPTALAIALR